MRAGALVGAAVGIVLAIPALRGEPDKTKETAAEDRGGEEAAVIRRQSEQYGTAIRRKDATALSRLLADGYSQCSFQLPDGDKKGAIGYVTAPERAFASFKTVGVRVRLDGDTAVETGEVSALGTEYGTNFEWGGIKYSRVWLKRSGVWRVAHEYRG
jgi:ketosteroid isomerase-like protein